MIFCVKSRGRFNRAPKIVKVQWIPPSPGQIKANIYGVAAMTGCGGIFRTYSCFCKGSFALLRSSLWALLQLLNFLNTINWSNPWFQSDSTYVMDLLKCQSSFVLWKPKTKWIAMLNYLDAIHLKYLTSFMKETQQQIDQRLAVFL